MTKVLYPGSFNPITKGHMKIIEQASEIFDEVIVAIIHNINKQNELFDIPERLEIIKELYKNKDNIKVLSSAEPTFRVAKENDCRLIIRGIRDATDFDYENRLQQTNREISNGEVQTIILFADKEYQNVSSSMVRELYYFDIDFSRYVDPLVKDKMLSKKIGGKNNG